MGRKRKEMTKSWPDTSKMYFVKYKKHNKKRSTFIRIEVIQICGDDFIVRVDDAAGDLFGNITFPYKSVVGGRVLCNRLIVRLGEITNSEIIDVVDVEKHWGRC